MPSKFKNQTIPSPPLSSKPLLASKEAATLLGVSEQTLRVWRVRAIGPRYFRLGPASRTIRYRIEDLADFLIPGTPE